MPDQQQQQQHHHHGTKAAARRFMSALPTRSLMPWLIFLCVLYLIVSLAGTGGAESDTRILDIALQNLPNDPPVIQAFVYIAMGPMAKESLTEYSVATLRKVGGWKGKIFILTDNPSCFTQAIKAFDVTPQKVPAGMEKSLMTIKSLKARMFEFLPVEITSAVYLDVDIMVERPLQHFLMDIGHTRKTMGDSFDVGAFPDAQGHYLGFCSGCEKWHTGIVFSQRYHGQKCLKEWSKILLSGKYDTDQESMDAAEESGVCAHMMTLPPSYLLFAKDYIAMALTSGHTFVHVTAAGRPDAQGFFYKNIIMPNLRGNFVDDIDLSRVEKSEQCLTK